METISNILVNNVAISITVQLKMNILGDPTSPPMVIHHRTTNIKEKEARLAWSTGDTRTENSPLERSNY